MKEHWPELQELAVTRLMTANLHSEEQSWLVTTPFPPTAKGLTSLKLWDPDMWDWEYSQILDAVSPLLSTFRPEVV